MKIMQPVFHLWTEQGPFRTNAYFHGRLFLRQLGSEPVPDFLFGFACRKPIRYGSSVLSLKHRFHSLIAVRIATHLLPPLGLFLLWRSSQVRRVTKVLGTIYIAAYSVLFVSGVLALLIVVFGVDLVEWRGGYLPAITFSKTLPDYDRLELSRARQVRDGPRGAARQTPVYAGAYWTGFRGPNCEGMYEERPILTNWPAVGLRELWRQPIGGGYASFAIAEGRAYTIEQRRQQEVVTAYELDTGRELWAHGWDARFEEAVGEDGPRATPAYDQGRIYALGATGEFRCLDAATGSLLWRCNIMEQNHAEVMKYGVSASPFIVGQKVIVLPGGRNGSSVVAYDKTIGSAVWKSANDKQAYTTPMLVTLAGQEQLLIVSARNALGIAPEDGRVLWHTPWIVQNDNAVAQPVLLGTNRFLLSGGYGLGCASFEVTPSNSAFTARPLWRNTHLKNKFTSSVLYQGYIYGLDDDVLTCLNATTGERKWRQGHYGYGQVLLASGHLIVLGGDGVLALVAATPLRFEELAHFQALHGKTWNHPAIANGRLFVRNAVEMACFDISAP
jgi:outer membrane protein assembly factor BamB